MNTQNKKLIYFEVIGICSIAHYNWAQRTSRPTSFTNRQSKIMPIEYACHHRRALFLFRHSQRMTPISMGSICVLGNDK